jgi:hypothetical protein
VQLQPDALIADYLQEDHTRDEPDPEPLEISVLPSSPGFGGGGGGGGCSGVVNEGAHDMAAVAPVLFWATARAWATRYGYAPELVSAADGGEEAVAEEVGMEAPQRNGDLEAERESRVAAERVLAAEEAGERALAAELAHTQAQIAHPQALE